MVKSDTPLVNREHSAVRCFTVVMISVLTVSSWFYFVYAWGLSIEAYGAIDYSEMKGSSSIFDAKRRRTWVANVLLQAIEEPSSAYEGRIECWLEKQRESFVRTDYLGIALQKTTDSLLLCVNIKKSTRELTNSIEFSGSINPLILFGQMNTCAYFQLPSAESVKNGDVISFVFDDGKAKRCVRLKIVAIDLSAR